MRPLGKAVVLLVLILAAQPGCATPDRAAGRAPETPVAPPETGPFVILETLPASGAVDGADLYSHQAEVATLEILGAGFIAPVPGTPAPRITRTASRPGEHGGEIALALGDERTEFLAFDGNGNTVMPAAVDHARRALTRFDPPLLIAYDALPAGAVRSVEADMVVLDVRNPRRQREAGRGLRTIEYVDDQRVSGPLGIHRAKRVRVRFTAELRLARAEDTVTYWVVPGVGVVAEEREERLTILGIAGKPKRRCLLRVR